MQTTKKKPRKVTPSAEEQYKEVLSQGSVKVVQVTWLDAFTQEGWIPTTDLPRIATKPPIVQNIGVELINDDDCIILATSFGPGQVSGVFRVPKGMVLDKWEIGETYL